MLIAKNVFFANFVLTAKFLFVISIILQNLYLGNIAFANSKGLLPEGKCYIQQDFSFNLNLHHKKDSSFFDYNFTNNKNTNRLYQLFFYLIQDITQSKRFNIVNNNDKAMGDPNKAYKAVKKSSGNFASSKEKNKTVKQYIKKQNANLKENLIYINSLAQVVLDLFHYSLPKSDANFLVEYGVSKRITLSAQIGYSQYYFKYSTLSKSKYKKFKINEQVFEDEDSTYFLHSGITYGKILAKISLFKFDSYSIILEPYADFMISNDNVWNGVGMNLLSYSKKKSKRSFSIDDETVATINTKFSNYGIGCYWKQERKALDFQCEITKGIEFTSGSSVMLENFTKSSVIKGPLPYRILHNLLQITYSCNFDSVVLRVSGFFEYASASYFTSEKVKKTILALSNIETMEKKYFTEKMFTLKNCGLRIGLSMNI